MSIISDEDYQKLHWNSATVQEFRELITGGTVLEAYGIDNPLDGAELIFRDIKGRILVMSFTADTDNYVHVDEVIRSHKNRKLHERWLDEPPADGFEPLYITWAVVN